MSANARLAADREVSGSASGSAASGEPEQYSMTVDDLSTAAGMTVRTTRYYASLGLIPPPERRGRMAWYGAEHLARLEMIRALQDHGFTLQAIEGYLSSLPDDARMEDLAVQRAMLTSWTLNGPQDLTRRQLEQHAGRKFTDDELALAEEIGMVVRSDSSRGPRFTPVHGFDITVRLLDLGLPVEGVRAANEAIEQHMGALATELTRVLRHDVLAPLRIAELSADEAEQLEQNLSTLRQLTLEAIVSAFQRSANDVIARSLRRQ